MHDEDATMKVKKFQITFRLTDFNVEVFDNFFFFREFLKCDIVDILAFYLIMKKRQRLKTKLEIN